MLKLLQPGGFGKGRLRGNRIYYRGFGRRKMKLGGSDK